jgi:AraC-like DNA-binding protein
MQHPIELKKLAVSTTQGRKAYNEYESFVAANFARLAMRLRKDQDFQIQGAITASSGFKICRFKTHGGQAFLERSSSEIQRDTQDSYAIYVPLNGHHEVEQFSRAARCGPGSLAMVAFNDSFTHKKLGDNDTIYLFLPRRFVDQRISNVEDICSRLTLADGGIAGLASDAIVAFMKAVSRDDRVSSIDTTEFLTMASVIGELALLALNGKADLTSSVRSVRIANLSRAKRVIRNRFRDPHLTPATVAAACQLSLRYVQELFQQDGKTISEYIRDQRLNCARTLLICGAVRTVSEACFMCGLSNASQFSTAFRRAFGTSPSGVLRHGQ